MEELGKNTKSNETLIPLPRAMEKPRKYGELNQSLPSSWETIEELGQDREPGESLLPFPVPEYELDRSFDPIGLCVNLDCIGEHLPLERCEPWSSAALDPSVAPSLPNTTCWDFGGGL
jgi:hypothetical protein